MEAPQTRFARSGDAHIAYQVVGEGPDLLYIPGGFQHVELWWESAPRVALSDALAEHARLILTDKRGTGLSDRGSGLPPLEVQMDDIRAVLDDVGSDRAVLCAIHDAAPLVLLFAATYPERTLGLVLWGPNVAFTRRPDLPWLPTPAEYDELMRNRHVFGDPAFWDARLSEMAPSFTPEERRDFARVLRLSVSPGDAAEYMRCRADTDVRGVLATVRAPTLVVAREGVEADVVSARYAAERMTSARLELLPGRDAIPPAGDIRPFVDAVGRFVAEVQDAPPDEPDRVLATVMFTDIVDSTALSAELGNAAWRDLLAQHHSRVRRELARFRGREVDTAGDGFFATFDGPARAIRCAQAVRDSVAELDLDIRAGLHAGECELLDGKVTGIAVALGARVASRAAPGEILVSTTVKDLVAGSGIDFDDRGVAELKGIPGEWRLFAVRE